MDHLALLYLYDYNVCGVPWNPKTMSLNTTTTMQDNAAVISDIGRRYLQLQLTANIGPIRLSKLLEHFGSLQAIQSSSRTELQRVEGIGPKGAEAIFTTQEDVVEKEVQLANKHGLRIVCREDADYPAPLKHIPDPPICLYYKGQLKPTDAIAIAIVGTRRCSHYAREQSLRFAEMLAGAGFTIVSGLARGVDGHAHRGALQGGGRTIAVLGNGLPDIYPPEHKDLAEEIAQAGAVISECPISTKPSADNFPRRNRVITGLSLGIIVIEAGVRSGALITARLAHDYNREVFALPGRVDDPQRTAGVHQLLRDGQAKLITNLDDVLDELDKVGQIMRRDLQKSSSTTDGSSGPNDQTAPHDLAARLTDHQQKVFEAVRDEADHPDRIIKQTSLSTAQVMAALTALQLKGQVKQLPGNRFVARS